MNRKRWRTGQAWVASAAVSVSGRSKVVARVHGAARPRHPLGVLRANIGVAFEVLVDHAEPDRQIYLLGPRFDERLALGIDRHEGLLGDHPAGRAAALLEPRAGHFSTAPRLHRRCREGRDPARAGSSRAAGVDRLHRTSGRPAASIPSPGLAPLLRLVCVARPRSLDACEVPARPRTRGISPTMRAAVRELGAPVRWAGCCGRRVKERT